MLDDDLAHASAGFDAFNRHVVTSIPSVIKGVFGAKE
jgi:hypothetical protein